MRDVEDGYKLTSANSKLHFSLAKSHAYVLLNFQDENAWATNKLVPTGPDAEATLQNYLKFMRVRKFGANKSVVSLVNDPMRDHRCSWHQHSKDVVCQLSW